MKRVLPAPLLSASLFALWLALNQSVTPGQVLICLLYTSDAADE